MEMPCAISKQVVCMTGRVNSFLQRARATWNVGQQMSHPRVTVVVKTTTTQH